jgi:hypothetical protein
MSLEFRQAAQDFISCICIQNVCFELLVSLLHVREYGFLVSEAHNKMLLAS